MRAAPAPPAPAADAHAGRVLIIDFGAQYTRLIARRIRELGVYCEIFPWDSPPARMQKFAPQGVVLSGGPETVTAANAPQVHPAIFKLGVPLLGICYGMQAMARQLGGAVEASAKREFGNARLTLQNPSALFDGFGSGEQFNVWMSHSDHVTKPPPGFTRAAASDNAPCAAIADEKKRRYGVQFHPEVTHTEHGAKILRNFVRGICGCAANWKVKNIAAGMVEQMRAKTAGGNVLLALSGGVDSSVAAALLQRAVGERLHCVFVDTGLLRAGEGDQVMSVLRENLGVQVTRVDAAEEFFTALGGVTEPEQKRKIIGKLFVEIFEREAARLKNISFLAQGTIYPDVIESAGKADGGGAHVIKSHHNVGGLPQRMKLRLLEPLRELFKDEVRQIGMELGLPREMVFRHPFPGPGLGVRILGEVKKESAAILRRADKIFMEELHRHDLYDVAAQAFAVFLPVKSVGVVGDGRNYEYVIALRAVQTADFMTANCMEIPWPLLRAVAGRIINEVRGVSRVVYDISSKPPATIEWE
ncbi:MAG: glutamine-hydrolyzing GMP synthase [Gammaproteobacteria bacterium]|nr:glutamine-hydrolyzing GMP synthase [Gammaproteobacteria bacterium]